MTTVLAIISGLVALAVAVLKWLQSRQQTEIVQEQVSATITAHTAEVEKDHADNLSKAPIDKRSAIDRMRDNRRAYTVAAKNDSAD